MCGLSVIFAYAAAEPVDRGELQRVHDAQRHRGPDAEGTWLNADGALGMAHRRLSIIDLSDAAAQPMQSQDGRYVIVFNGEIYNYRELKADLERRDARFRGDSDTEVLLNLYAQQGAGMLERLRGMYAFAIWDAQSQSLFAARDPYGIKPLYYADDGRTLRLASQVRALKAGGRAGTDSNPGAAFGFLLFGSVPEPASWYSDIKSLPAGHHMLVSQRGCTIEPGWKLNEHWCATAPDEVADDEVVSRASAAVRDSVGAHMVADVPVGLFLSSGLDSAAMAAAMRAASGGPIEAITLRYEEYQGSADDEAPLAADIAREYGFEHHVHTVSRDQFLAAIPTILTDMDQPSIDGVNNWFVARAAAQRGLKVAISGLGGDELFGGYPSFGRVPKWVRRAPWIAWIPGIDGLLGRLARLTRVSPKLAGMARYGGDHAGAYLLQRAVFLPNEAPAVDSLLDPAGVDDYLEQLRALYRGLSDPGQRVAALESGWYMRNQLLRDADWAGMAHSVEIRTPLVDRELTERLAPISAGILGGTGKRPLAALLSDRLGARLLRRPKTGFTLPMQTWLRGGDGEGAADEHWSRSYARSVYRHWQGGSTA